jgi:hypothetical protein
MIDCRESYVRVMEYLHGQLNLTEYPCLTSKERITFTPLWHAAEVLSGMQAMQLADMLKLEELADAD